MDPVQWQNLLQPSNIPVINRCNQYQYFSGKVCQLWGTLGFPRTVTVVVLPCRVRCWPDSSCMTTSVIRSATRTSWPAATAITNTVKTQPYLIRALQSKLIPVSRHVVASRLRQGCGLKDVALRQVNYSTSTWWPLGGNKDEAQDRGLTPRSVWRPKIAILFSILVSKSLVLVFWSQCRCSWSWSHTLGFGDLGVVRPVLVLNFKVS